jgi:hypothetical protein
MKLFVFHYSAVRSSGAGKFIQRGGLVAIFQEDYNIAHAAFSEWAASQVSGRGWDISVRGTEIKHDIIERAAREYGIVKDEWP